MVKPDLGTKRECPNCNVRFYDLNNNPIICPKCECHFETEAQIRARRQRTNEKEVVPEPAPQVEPTPAPAPATDPAPAPATDPATDSATDPATAPDNDKPAAEAEVDIISEDAVLKEELAGIEAEIDDDDTEGENETFLETDDDEAGNDISVISVEVAKDDSTH